MKEALPRYSELLKAVQQELGPNRRPLLIAVDGAGRRLQVFAGFVAGLATWDASGLSRPVSNQLSAHLENR